MTLTELKYIIALAKNKHFGKAAAACHVSQPTLSVAVGKLEKELGVQIFERANAEIHVSQAGLAIVEQAQRVLEEADRVHFLAQDAQSQTKHPLRVGAIYTVAPYLFPHLIPNLRQQFPDMPLEIEENFTHKLREKLLQGQLDVAIVALPFANKAFVTKPIYHEPLEVLLPEDHPLAKETALDDSALKNEQMLLLGEGHCFRDQVLEACPHCITKDSMQKIVEGTSLETIRHMVASGLGLTVLPATATQVKYYNNLTTRPFAGNAPKRTVALAWRVSFPRPKAISALIKALSSCELLGVELV